MAAAAPSSTAIGANSAEREINLDVKQPSRGPKELSLEDFSEYHGRGSAPRVRKSIEFEQGPGKTEGSAAAAAAAAAMSSPPTKATTTSSDQTRRKPQPSRPQQIIIEQPTLTGRGAKGVFVTFKSPRSTLPLGIRSFTRYEAMHRTIAGEGIIELKTNAHIKATSMYRFLPVKTEPRLCIPRLSAARANGYSGGDLIGKPNQIIAACTHDAVSVIQFCAALHKPVVQVRVLLPPVPANPDTFFEHLRAATSTYVGKNVLKWNEMGMTMASTPLSVIAPPEDEKSLSGALAKVLNQHNKPTNTALFLDAPDWFDPTVMHYPDSKESYEELLLSPILLRSVETVMLSQRPFWLGQLGTVALRRISKHWDIYAQRGAGIHSDGAEQTDEDKAYDALIKAHDEAIAESAKHKDGSIPDIKNLMDAASQMHTENHDLANAEISKRARRGDPRQRGVAVFGKGMKGNCPHGKFFFVLKRKIEPVVASAPAAAAAAAAR